MTCHLGLISEGYACHKADYQSAYGSDYMYTSPRNETAHRRRRPGLDGLENGGCIDSRADEWVADLAHEEEVAAEAAAERAAEAEAAMAEAMAEETMTAEATAEAAASEAEAMESAEGGDAAAVAAAAAKEEEEEARAAEAQYFEEPEDMARQELGAHPILRVFVRRRRVEISGFEDGGVQIDMEPRERRSIQTVATKRVLQLRWRSTSATHSTRASPSTAATTSPRQLVHRPRTTRGALSALERRS